MTLQDRIVEEARSWVGTGFHHGAMVKGAGVDCVHLLIAVFVAAGAVERFEPLSYAPDWHLHSNEELLLVGLREHCYTVEPPWEVGDILTYRYGRTVSHCGIYVGDGMLVHAVSRDQVRCDPVEGGSLAKRFAGGWRLTERGT